MLDWLWRTRGPEVDLVETVERLERQVKTLRVEWEEWYDKLHRLYQRIAKRQKALESAESDDPPRAGPDGAPVNDRLAELNAGILARRGRGLPNGTR